MPNAVFGHDLQKAVKLGVVILRHERQKEGIEALEKAKEFITVEAILNPEETNYGG